MGSQHLGADFVYALPSSEIAGMGPEGAANVIFRRDISESQNPEATRKEKIEDYKNRFATPYQAASRGYIDSVINPADMRKMIYQSLEITRTKAESSPDKKHGNIPL